MSRWFKQQLTIVAVWSSAAVLLLTHLLADPQGSRVFTFILLVALATLVWMTHRLASPDNPISGEQDGLIEELHQLRHELALAERERARAEQQRDRHEQERRTLERHNEAVAAIRQTLDGSPTAQATGSEAEPVVDLTESEANFSAANVMNDVDTASEEGSIDDEVVAVLDSDDDEVAQPKLTFATSPDIAPLDATEPDTAVSLDDALRSVGDDVATRAGTEVEVHVSQDIDLTSGAFDDGENALLLRIAEEAAGNIVKHAGASRVIIDLTMDDGTAVLRVEDDGVGFDAAGQLASLEADEGLLSTDDGLGYFMDQVIDLDGTFQIGSTPGEGTTIVARLPISDE